ncbi:non-specific lipid transfer protein GPI-anchored 20-like [Lolium rigidum]|uniref:non-specific lipid transfer protein GPI-anchored 20-like n=1 Tax=Lolium rigidum TaxID=89674 RepID=UPI001F5DD37E|nr:non-specific lipid transfer protein GPI-anchored 20-like [Lolium rigidum]
MNLTMFAVAATMLLALAASVPAPVSGQAVVTSCAASLVTSFTPCLGYITGSTNGGGSSPTADCCQSLAAVVSASTSCACLILTGNVPFGLPINRTLALTLPKACNSMSVPLQCKDTSAQLPAPGPVAVSPAMPPLPPMAPELPAPTAEPTVTPAPSSQTQGQTRPQVVPSSAWRSSAGVSVLLAVVGTMLG